MTIKPQEEQTVRNLWNWIVTNLVNPNSKKSILDAQLFYKEFNEGMTEELSKERTLAKKEVLEELENYIDNTLNIHGVRQFMSIGDMEDGWLNYRLLKNYIQSLIAKQEK